MKKLYFLWVTLLNDARTSQPCRKAFFRKPLSFALIILSAALFIQTTTAYAQFFLDDEEEFIEDSFERFHDRCLNTQRAMISAESNAKYCACHKKGLETNFSAAQIDQLDEGKEGSASLRIQMIVRTQAPCMEQVVHDLILSNCWDNPRFSSKLKNAPQVCLCQARKGREYMIENNFKIAENMLTYRPDAPDLLNDYLQSHSFNMNSTNFLKHCIHEEEYGWR